MKKTFVFLSTFLILTITGFAQITLNTGDVAVPTTVKYQAVDIAPTVLVGSPGAGSQSWNMAALATNRIDTLTFLPYSSFPNPLFSTSNMIVKQGWQNDFAYALNNASSLTILGNHGTVNIATYPTVVNQKFTPSEELATFPFTYNSNFVNTYRAKAKFYFGHTLTVGTNTVQVDSIRDHSTINKTVVVDAWGTLTTPLGVYTVIRSKETKITHDTVDAYAVPFPGFGFWSNAAQTSADSTTSYTWWANGLGYSLATAVMDSAGAVKRVQWLMQAPTVGISENNEIASGAAFPNPAQNEITILTDASKQKSIEVFDMTGRKIESFLVTNNLTRINSSAYANGMYSYSITNKDNAIIYKGKFAISK